MSTIVNKDIFITITNTYFNLPSSINYVFNKKYRSIYGVRPVIFLFLCGQFWLKNIFKRNRHQTYSVDASFLKGLQQWKCKIWCLKMWWKGISQVEVDCSREYISYPNCKVFASINILTFDFLITYNIKFWLLLQIPWSSRLNEGH